MFGHRRLAAAALLVVTIAGACASGPATFPAVSINLPPTPQPGATPTPGDPTATGGPVGQGGDLCGLLGPGDFAAIGVGGATTPLDNYDDAGNHFCTYAGTAGAMGSIEFDAFVTDVLATYQSLTAGASIAPDDNLTQLLAVDRAGIALDGPGGAAILVACSGQFCFDISIPTTAAARTELIGLARMVLERATALTS
jgi:hypothetical protein